MTSLAIPLRISVPSGARFGRHDEPVSGGVSFPQGVLRDDSEWTLVDAAGVAVPFDLHATDRWSDGSVRWAVLDAQVDVPASASHVSLQLQRQSSPAARAASRLAVRQGSDGFTIDTGVSCFELSRRAPFLIAQASAGGATWTCAGSELQVRSGGAALSSIEWERPTIEFAGALRAVVSARGAAAVTGGGNLAFTIRFDFYAGSGVVRTRLTVRNPRRANHPGGIWELGDAGSILLDEVSLAIRKAGQGTSRVRWSLEPGVYGAAASRFSVHQASSGGERWASTNHVDRAGAISLPFRGYRGKVDGEAVDGLRATPFVILENAALNIGAAVPQFWENFPRALEATSDELIVSFMPRADGAHELQGGEQKTHECYLLFGTDRVCEQPLDWCRARLVLHAEPEWYAASGAVPRLVTASDDDPRYRALVDAALDGADSLVAKREVADEYGWRHFGDIYGDHEAVFHKGPAPLMSHYNNQYDPVAGFLYQFLRTGDARWWAHCRDLAAHVIDIDIYHTQQDKSAYNHGLFWHTCHYVDAGRSTHRSYPAGTVGGGPSSEHNYTTGLMLHYFVTGDVASREAAIDLAQFVIDIDDGAKTIFRFLDRGYTGVASASRTFDYHGPGRGSANSLNALLDGHRLSGDRRFLDKAEQLIRRCTHPAQDVSALNLLDAENRWFYTMYLQSLAKYLDWKIELGELDAMYAYARGVLLHFARWMAANERPYLDCPEILEYPTETWPAQDIRKSEVFDAAAAHADASERDLFLERAEFFFDYSMRTLLESPTRTLARPMVLLLVHGFRRAWARRNGVVAAPAPLAEWVERWPRHETFVPQKARAKRRAIIAAAAAGAVATLGAAALGATFLF